MHELEGGAFKVLHSASTDVSMAGADICVEEAA